MPAIINANPGATPTLQVTKTITFTGAAGLGAVGAVPLFNVTGLVLVEKIIPVCSADLTEAAATATLALGVTGSTALFIAATTATAIDVGEYWLTTTPGAVGLALPAALTNIVIAANIIGTVAAQAVNGGTLRFLVHWRPISEDGNLVAA